VSTDEVVVGIDLGTSVVKAGVYTCDGRLCSAASVPVGMCHGPHGLVEQDLDEFYAAAASATRAAQAGGAASRRVVGLALAGQMAGVGIVGPDHRPLAPYDSWLDTRCADVVDELATTHGERIARSAGCAPTVSIGPKMLWWRRHRPQVLDRAASFVTAAGYVAGRAVGLSGHEAFIDPSYLHFASFTDVGAGAWDTALARDCGVDVALLPRVVEGADAVGALTSAAAADFGLPVGVPVAAGCGDTAASALGAGVFEAGQGFDVAGTAGVFGVCLPAFVPDVRTGTLMTMRSALPGRWYSLAYVAGAGQLVEWACWELLGCGDLDDAAYAVLADAVSSVPVGSGGVVAFPHLSGRVAPAAPEVRGAFVGLTPMTTHAHLARAVLESIALEYRGYAQIVRQGAGPDAVTEVVGTGGGSRSEVWNQIKADALGVPYRPVVGVDPGTRGAAVLAMAALGIACPPLGSHDLAPASMPNPVAGGAYAQAAESYRRWADILVAGYARAGSSGSAGHSNGRERAEQQ